MTKEQYYKAKELQLEIEQYEHMLNMLQSEGDRPLTVMPEMSFYGHVKELFIQSATARLEKKKTEFETL